MPKINCSVSVVIPNWNGQHLLKVCLTSLRKQTFKNFEINLDEVENLGKFVEVELKGKDPQSLRVQIIEFVRKVLNIPESNIIQKGYVKLLLSE